MTNVCSWIRLHLRLLQTATEFILLGFGRVIPLWDLMMSKQGSISGARWQHP